MRRTFASASFFCTFAVGIVILFFHEFFAVQSFALNGFFVTFAT